MGGDGAEVEARRVRRLAGLLFKEFEEDGWGDVDPYLFGLVADGLTEGVDADGEPLDEDLANGSRDLRDLLVRVVDKF